MSPSVATGRACPQPRGGLAPNPLEPPNPKGDLCSIAGVLKRLRLGADYLSGANFGSTKRQTRREAGAQSQGPQR